MLVEAAPLGSGSGRHNNGTSVVSGTRRPGVVL